MADSDLAARDGQEIGFRGREGDWVVSWHSAAVPPPSGTAHGSSAICITPDGDVVLVSQDGELWDLPGGRPEAGEDWRETLDREVREEACATVGEATLLGFTMGVCKSGPEEGLVLVRAIWHASVLLLEWDPRHEMSRRRVVPFHDAIDLLDFSQSPRPIAQWAFLEAAIIEGDVSLRDSGE